MSRQRKVNRKRLPLFVLALSLLGLIAVNAPALAVPDAGAVVIDDFEDNDTSDWGFFGGNNAGGGGGPFDDRPYEGNYYLSTGWGGEGTASGFYGGGFKNFDDAAQVTLPAVDPWFNVWVYNQSDATADAYTLEITLREDLDGNGWTNGAEDSFLLDTSFTSGDFDDQWRLVSAPLSALLDLGTGGDGTFNGNLDEVVIVIAGVTGANPSTVELDFDLFAFSSGGPLAWDEVVFDDMEHGDPGASGWFSFTGVAGGGIGGNSSDLPPADGGLFSLETGWGSGGTPGFFGGFGRTNPVDISGTDHFNFWINPDAGQDYLLEINLQEDDNSDGAINPPDDDEFQYNCVVSAIGPCAVAGGGWQLVSIPLDDFFDDNSFLTGGNGVLDPTTLARGGNGELFNVVITIISDTGADVTFRTDYWAFTRGQLVPDFRRVIDDFEAITLPAPADQACAPGAPPLNFCTFSGANSSAVLSNPTTPPAPELPAVGTPNSVLQMDSDVTSFAGFIRGFEVGGDWVPQDWSRNEGFSLWFHGTGSNTDMFVDILENRNPGSTTDDAERWRVDFVDDFVGWQQLEFAFTEFRDFPVGNGAPNDGRFDRFEVHGWAVGSVNTPGPLTFYIDQVELFGEAELPGLSVGFAEIDTEIEEGTTGDVVVKLNRPIGAEDPGQVSVDYATDISGAIAGEEYTPTSGTLTFTEGGPTELSFPIETFDDSKFEGDERIVLRLSNPVDVELASTQARAQIVDNEEFDPLLLDDFEQGAYLWDTQGPAEIDALRLTSGDPYTRPGQDAVENVATVVVPRSVDINVEGKVCTRRNRGVVPVQLLSTADFDATTVDHRTVSFGSATESHLNKNGKALRHVEDVNGDGMYDLVFHFRRSEINAGCDSDEVPFNGYTFDGKPITAGGSDAAFGRDFAIGQDWSQTEKLSFWYYGSGGGEDVTVTLKDNRAADPGPSGWGLVWSDEFDEPAGTPPSEANWTHEIGDGALNGILGWGNSEDQYYTDDPANAATDGNGNLVVTLREADGSLECFYGTCTYTSARLISWHKAEFAYGRVEARIQVPNNGADFRGLWPAFWSLGTDISYNPWPGAGEIDVMEWVGRLPNEIFGTIHGPGYSGGNAFGNIYDFGVPVPNDYHTFTIEWEPDKIVWYVDGIQYHQAEPADVPGPWVYNKPFFLLINFAIGGNFGGVIGDNVQFPQDYLLDYVRVYQGPDTAERFETSFVDNFVGWQEVTIPVTDFTRSDDQPAGAPDDGLGLEEVWGYGFATPDGNATGQAKLDLVTRALVPPPAELTVTSLADDGDGSLRDALSRIADGGTISLDPALAGQTIALTSGQLVVDRSVIIDAAAAPGVVISGNNSSRVFQIENTATVSMNDLEVADGAAAPQGGGILNFGTLNLDRVVVRDNVQNLDAAPNFEFGGGGIYNGAGATLNLTDSTVADNTSVTQPGGGVYGFFGSTINITRSTISGNLSGDVAGGLRLLSNGTIVNSTFSGNTSAAWHGGGIFHTDGDLTVTNSTFSGNVAPAGTASGILVATFGSPASATLTNNVIEGNGGAFACAIEGGGAATITSGGFNVISDGSCSPIGTDQSNTDALLEPLADNGGPTLTHALGAGSPAIDTADAGACPATDQRGVARPQGAGCDVGAFEVQ